MQSETNPHKGGPPHERVSRTEFIHDTRKKDMKKIT